MRTLMLLTILAIISTKVQADPVTKTKDWLTNEWQDIKEYQANAWEQGKEQNAKNLNTIKNFFVKVKDNVTQD